MRINVRMRVEDHRAFTEKVLKRSNSSAPRGRVDVHLVNQLSFQAKQEFGKMVGDTQALEIQYVQTQASLNQLQKSRMLEDINKFR